MNENRIQKQSIFDKNSKTKPISEQNSNKVAGRQTIVEEHEERTVEGCLKWGVELQINVGAMGYSRAKQW